MMARTKYNKTKVLVVLGIALAFINGCVTTREMLEQAPNDIVEIRSDRENLIKCLEQELKLDGWQLQSISLKDHYVINVFMRDEIFASIKIDQRNISVHRNSGILLLSGDKLYDRHVLPCNKAI